MNLDKKIIDKWNDYVTKHLKMNNVYLEFIFCHYLEYLQSENKDIGKEIVNFKNKISTKNKYKKEIIKEYFNCLTGRKEYLLNDGSFIDVDNFVYSLDINDLVDIFGLEFLNKFDIVETRDFKIDKILNNED